MPGETIGEDAISSWPTSPVRRMRWNGPRAFTGVPNVGDRAFKDCNYLTCVYLNDDITTIGDHAFYKDEYLSAINMPRKLELIDQYAFYGCDTLTFVRARACSHLKRIEERAFYSCTTLAELRLPDCLTYIGPWAFAWDRILGQEDTTLGLPSNLQTIGKGAFAFINHHKKLNIPSQVTSIGDYAFLCDYYMEELTFSPGDQKLTIGVAAFAGDNHMKSVDLSNRVAQIDRCAFAGCELLEEAYFGDKIDTIEGRAFTSVDAALQLAIKAALNRILDPDNPDGNEEHADDIAAGLTQIAKVTQLKRAIFKNAPAKTITGTADTNSSFPRDCVVYYPQGSYAWAAELKDDGTWQGYKTGLWHGDHIAQFADTVVDPTCTKQGYTHHACTVKGCTYAPVDDTYVAATDHTWVTQTFPASCTEQGTVFYKCSACGATRTEKIAALGHDLSRCDLFPATCTKSGRVVGTCARCGVQIDEVIPAKGHDYSYADVRTDPTCTESGHYKGTCPTCGKDYDDVIPALDHDWGEWVVAQEPTYTTTGYRYHICARCNARVGEDIPKLHEHVWNAGVVTQKPTATRASRPTPAPSATSRKRSLSPPPACRTPAPAGRPARATPSAICPRRTTGRTRGWITASTAAISTAFRPRLSTRAARARAHSSCASSTASRASRRSSRGMSSTSSALRLTMCRAASGIPTPSCGRSSRASSTARAPRRLTPAARSRASSSPPSCTGTRPSTRRTPLATPPRSLTTPTPAACRPMPATRWPGPSATALSRAFRTTRRTISNPAAAPRARRSQPSSCAISRPRPERRHSTQESPEAVCFRGFFIRPKARVGLSAG